MADIESLKQLAGVWASGPNADRGDPEDFGIDRSEGWDVAYEQIGSGSEPERLVFNQKMREWSGAFVDEMRRGIGLWDGLIDFPQYARVIDSTGRKMLALIATGPRSGNVTDPTAPGQQIWREF